MDMDTDLSEYLNDFYGDILRAEANLQYFAHAVSTLTYILYTAAVAAVAGSSHQPPASTSRFSRAMIYHNVTDYYFYFHLPFLVLVRCAVLCVVACACT